MGVILKGLGGSREGPTRLETLALHVCIPAGSGSWDPSVGSSVPRALVVAAGGEPSPGPRPLWRGERQGPRSCTLVCMHPRPRPAPRCVHTHADACTHTPCMHRCCAGCRGASSGRSSPAPSLQRAPTLWGLFFFRCLVRWFSSQTPSWQWVCFRWAFFFPPPRDSSGARERYHGSCAPPAPGLFGVGWQPAGCWIKEPQRNTGG